MRTARQVKAKLKKPEPEGTKLKERKKKKKKEREKEEKKREEGREKKKVGDEKTRKTFCRVAFDEGRGRTGEIVGRRVSFWVVRIFPFAATWEQTQRHL
ncbi:hypothetical protein CEXT_67171 [Caerostris extrusa]|uniref:Uncharacterized protein n=1 Tax=Caerostris extrusa TaxID=172846 RepID=A0AAV4Y0I5_CAEEX|nr:hypothetical protein CEXT_67171 [Caerostris extrusa]